MMTILPYLFIVALLAFWISAICGGGASLILVPLLNFTLPVEQVPFSLTIGTVASSASRIIVFIRSVRWRIVVWFVPAALPAVLIGAWVIRFVNPVYLQFAVGLLLLLNIPDLLRKRNRPVSTAKPFARPWLACIGFLAGLISGITGAIGLLFNRFYLKYGLSKEEIVATRAANEISLHFIKLIIYLLVGLYSLRGLMIGLMIACAAVLASLTIRYILPYISDTVFRKIGFGTMVISGIALLISTTRDIYRNHDLALSIRKNEAILRWQSGSLSLEYSYDQGLEVERSIPRTSLPSVLKGEYDELVVSADYILLEKVYRFRTDPVYEFYIYRNGKMEKKDFSVPDSH